MEVMTPMWPQALRHAGLDQGFALRLQSLVLFLQLFGGLAPGRIEGNARYRAHLLALRLMVVTDAFGAFLRIDFVDFRTHGNGVVRALGLAHVAIDAVIRNQ